MIQSVDKALQLLGAVASSDGWCGVRELARQTGLNASTAHHLLKTLKDNGYLESDPETGRYRIGIAAILMGARQDSFLRLAEAVKPRLDKLFDELGSAVVGLVVKNGTFVANYWKQDVQGVLFTPAAGTNVPQPHRMACGCVLLPWQSESWLANYRAEHKLPDSFLQTLRDLKGKGVYVSSDTWGNGTGPYAIGVTVSGFGKEPLMSIGWSEMNSAVSKEKAKFALEQVTAAAAELSAMLKLE